MGLRRFVKECRVSISPSDNFIVSSYETIYNPGGCEVVMVVDLKGSHNEVKNIWFIRVEDLWV